MAKHSHLIHTTVYPWWKINSFLSKISVCWSCTDKNNNSNRKSIFHHIAGLACNPSQLPAIAASSNSAAANLRFNTQWATANARWHLPSHTIVDCIGDLSSVCWLKRLLIEVATVACRLGANVYCNGCYNRRFGESTWCQHLLIEVVTVASTWCQH